MEESGKCNSPARLKDGPGLKFEQPGRGDSPAVPARAALRKEEAQRVGRAQNGMWVRSYEEIIRDPI